MEIMLGLKVTIMRRDYFPKMSVVCKIYFERNGVVKEETSVQL